MVTVPHGSIVLDNPNGMAPGLIMEKMEKQLFYFPGPPNELYPFLRDRCSLIWKKRQNSQLVSHMVKDLRIRGKPGRR